MVDIVNESRKYAALALSASNMDYYTQVADTIDRLRAEVASLKELSVTNIMLNVVPGDDGMGQEVYAKSVDEVVAAFTRLSEERDQAVQKMEAGWLRLTESGIGYYKQQNDTLWQQLRDMGEQYSNDGRRIEELTQQLAAVQLYSKGLREALEAARVWSSVALFDEFVKPQIEAALSAPSPDLSALDGYVRDAERYRWATALDENAGDLHSIVLCNAGNQENINARVDVYRNAAIQANAEKKGE